MKTIKNKSITLNLIPSLSVSFKEASFDVPLVEEGGIYHFLLETLQRLGLTPMVFFRVFVLPLFGSFAAIPIILREQVVNEP